MEQNLVAEAFDGALMEIVSDLLQHPDHVTMSQAHDWLKKVLQYNLKSGKNFRGLVVVHACRHFSKDNCLKLLKKSCIVGWCLEILHASFLMADDMMDHSELRRGQLCWYRLDNLGLAAINDVFLLESCMFYILKKHFKNEKYYSSLLDLFHDAVLKTTLGQSSDLLTPRDSKDDLGRLTMKRYEMIVKFKTSHYSFCLPFLLAFVLCEIEDESYVKNVEEILLEVGYIFQVQDDMLDCFGDPKVTGKNGTDIIEGKCTWLIVSALEKCNDTQRKILEENYGKGEETDFVDRVVGIFKELKMEEEFKKQEIESRQKIGQLINKLPNQKFHHQFYYDFLKNIYSRQK